jgi:FMN-dependent NADH-azoreductase
LVRIGQYSIKLGHAIVEKIQKKYPNSTIEKLNLAEQEIPHLNPASLLRLLTPANLLNENKKESIHFSNNLLRQLFAADIIVIGASFYNFTIHSTLKAWIDYITRPVITFGYGEYRCPIGMVTKKNHIAIASGAIYSEGLGKN